MAQDACGGTSSEYGGKLTPLALRQTRDARREVRHIHRVENRGVLLLPGLRLGEKSPHWRN